MQGAENDRGSLNDYIQALAAALELPDDGAMQAGQRMNAPQAGAAQQVNTNFAPSAHAQSYSSPHRSAHHSPHPSPRAQVHDPFAAATAAAPQAQAHSGAHSAGHSGAYSNHSGGAYNSGASGGQPSVGPHQGNFGYDAQGHGGHYPSEVPGGNAAMLRGPLDDVWPAPNQHGVSAGQGRPCSDDRSNLQSAFNMVGNGPYPPRPPFGSQHPSHSQLSAPAAPGSRRQSLGGGSSNFLPNFGRAPSEGRENRSTSGYSLGGSDGGPTYPLSGPHSDGPHARDTQVQSIVNLNTLGLIQAPVSWDGNPIGNSENSGGQSAVAGGYMTPRALGCSVGRASSAPLAQPTSQDNSAQGASARPKRRRRNEQQQVNNKLAQQRYREKQKMKTRELEGQVEELQAQLKALETSSGRSRELMQENEALRTQHQQLRAQVEKLQAHVKKVGAGGDETMDADFKPPQGSIDDLNFSEGMPSVDGTAAAAAAAAIAAAGADVPGSPPAGDVDMEDRSGGAGDVASSGPGGADMANTAHRLGVVTEHIRKLLTDQGLPTDTVIKDDVRYSDLNLRRELATLVQGHNTSCSKILVGKGSEASAIMQTDQAAAQDMWGRCLVGIHLCDQQVTQILDARTKLLQRMHNLSDVRSHLALHAVGILLPSRQRPSTHPSQEARLQSLETNGAFEVLHQEQELQDSLDEVSGNLRKGRQVIVEFNQFVITKVLKVEQAAVLLCMTHPHHPDCLALANLMAQTRRNVTSGTGTRS